MVKDREVLTGVAELPSERRREHRISVTEDALATIVREDCPPSDALTILDISAKGMKLRSCHPVDPGTLLLIQLPKMMVLARVRRCSKAKVGFDVGVLIFEVTGPPTGSPSENESASRLSLDGNVLIEPNGKHR